MLTMLLALIENEDEKRIFAEVYEKYYNKMAAVAAHYFKTDPATAEDAVHNAFIKVIQHLEKLFEIPGNELAYWLVLIVKNESLSILRKQKKLVPFEDWDTWEAQNALPDDSRKGYRQIVEVIRGMPETYRAVLELRFVLEWEYQDIAQMLDISEGTVKSRINRGRAILTERLKKEGFLP